MTHPSASRIHLLRWRLTVLFRSAALVCASIAVGLVISRIQRYWEHFTIAQGGSAVLPSIMDYFAAAVVLLSTAAGLYLSQRFALKWMVPFPAAECPACGYSLLQFTGERCPECGTALAAPRPDSGPNPTRIP